MYKKAFYMDNNAKMHIGWLKYLISRANGTILNC